MKKQSAQRQEWDRIHNLQKYGLSVADYDVLFHQQGGRCALCAQQETAKDNTGIGLRKLNVDHNHITGIVRGLLCSSCNLLLGASKEHISTLKLAIAYLLDERPWQLKNKSQC